MSLNSHVKPALRIRLITVVSSFALLLQIVFIGPVRKADAKSKPPIADTSSPAEPFIVNTPRTFATGLASLLGFLAPTVKKESPKTEESAVEPPSPATVQPVPFLPAGTAADLAALRLKPGNATGGTDLYSRNFGWGTSLVGLPGRAGLDAGFGISYNSLVWIKDPNNNEIIFDPDISNVSPGFQMGFPVIEAAYYDTVNSRYAFLMINPDGSRTEFRRVGSTIVFEGGDSSYRELKTTTGTVTSKGGVTQIKVTATDGTVMLYTWDSSSSRYYCREVKDRNGNYISIDFNGSQMTSVTDTLGRVFTINYDGGGYPTTITQTWKATNGEGASTTHTWATFSYTNATVSATFSGGLTRIGPANSSTVKVLEKITYPDSSFTKFEYNGYIQVKKISQVAADSTSHILNYVTTDLASVSGTQSDCPRFGETKTWVENFNGGSEVVVTNSLTTGATYSLPNSITGSATRIDVAMTGHPDGLYSRTYVGASGYKEGLTLATEDCTGTNCATRLRWTWTDWTQDNTGVSYITNPRVVESRVGDGTNIKKTTVGYGSNGYGLPEEVKVYDSDLSTVLKTQTTAYLLTSTYTDRRIIGLPSETKLWEGTTSGTLMSKVTYTYDAGNMTGTDPVQNISPTQHDNTNYTSSFVTGRGLLTSMTRWDATAPTTSGSAVTSSMKYNTAGAVVSKTDPLSHTVKIAYADNFNTTGNPTTYAYPTTITDQNSQSSTIKYRYDIGANIVATSPAPAGQTYGKTSIRLFDSIGRLDRQSIYVNTTEKAYTRYEYPTNGIQSKSYTPIIDADGDTNIAEDEVYTESWFDGAGRVRGSRTEHPGSTGGWTATQTEYDVLGRVYRTSVPTEISAGSSPYSPSDWTAAGDDYTRGWIWNKAYYDWKGRTIRTVPSDSTGSDGKDTLISYTGCGCAGGMVTTIEGPSVPRDDTSGNARRKQKVYADILGRDFKTEVYAWDGSTVYTTTVNTFNGRDQVTNTRQYAGTTSATTYQDVTMTYDGHARMATRHYPIEESGHYTSWTYNTDDSISQIVDPRGAITDLTYNSRGLTTQIAYTPNSGGVDTPTVDYTYDNLGNRTSMDTAGVSATAYSYNELSQLTGETVDFDDLSSNLTLSYAYNIGGGLKSVTDPFSQTINYTNDKTGRLTDVGGTTFGDVTSGTTNNYAAGIKYRAFGSVKEMTLKTDDNNVVTMAYDDALRVSEHKATSDYPSGGYMQNADYTYAADSKPISMDNQINNGFDRTFKFDFAGRLTANSFGTVNSKTVYDQAITYDAFSQMTNRSTTHWDETGGFAATYANGRKTSTSPTPTYDYAGNETATGSRGDGSGEVSTFDAANRITSNTSNSYQPTGGGHHVLFVHRSDLTYDGDGHAIKSQEGNRAGVGTLTMADPTYQVWSSVLNSSVTEVYNNGAKKTTKVFAGGAVIAEQNTFGGAQVIWISADPVSGSSIRMSKAGSTSEYDRTELEPLGQEVTAVEPPEEEQDPAEYAGQYAAHEPEWQCQVAAMKGQEFDMPGHCMRAGLDSFQSARVDEVIASSRMNNNPKYISGQHEGGHGSDSSAIAPTSKQFGNSNSYALGPLASIPSRKGGPSADDGPQGCPDGFHEVDGVCVVNDGKVEASMTVRPDEDLYQFSAEWGCGPIDTGYGGKFMHCSERLKFKPTPLPCDPLGQNYLGTGVDGIGGVGEGMATAGWTFRLTNGSYNGSQLSPKLYPSGWNGGSIARISTYSTSAISDTATGLSLGIVAYDTIASGYEEGGFGQNTQIALGRGIGSVAGAVIGAKVVSRVGFAIGGLAGPKGAAIGALGGGVVGGIGGGHYGGNLGEYVTRKLQGSAPRRPC